MTPREKYIASACIGYLSGSINTGVLASKYLYKDDVREHGSGNAGATNMARTFGLDAGAVIRIVKGIYASAGLGFFSCSPTKSEGSATLGLCIPAGVSVLIGKAFVIQAGVSYYPSVDIGVTKTVKTSVGPSYTITTAQNVLQACVAPRISLGLAF